MLTTTIFSVVVVCMVQILQEQQALLLEGSPVYLASLSQDKEDSLLNQAADAHDTGLAGVASPRLRAWQPGPGTETAFTHSRWLKSCMLCSVCNLSSLLYLS